MRWKIGLILGVILIAAAVVIGWQLSPRMISITPADQALHGSQSFTVAFSRPMRADSVENSLILIPSQTGDFRWSADLRELTFTPQTPWPAGETLSLDFEPGARSRLNLPLLGKPSAKIPISPILLIYLWPADGASNLYLANPESGETWAISAEETGVLDYTISQDRDLVFYSAAEEAGSRIMILDRSSGSLGPVVECSSSLCTSPRISPDGYLLAYEEISHEPGSRPTIQVSDLESGTLIDLGEGEQHLESPLWSPAGWLAYYNRSQQAYQFWNPITGEKKSLPNQTGGDGSWSSDGRYFICSEILFLSDTLAPRHLILFDLREGTSLDLSRGSYPEDLNPSFAPDGLVLAYSHKSLDPQFWTPGRELWILDIRTGENTQLTESVDFHHTSYAWHPDGQLLAYVRYNQAALSDPPEIWMINSRGGEPLRLIINGFQPGWVP